MHLRSQLEQMRNEKAVTTEAQQGNWSVAEVECSMSFKLDRSFGVYSAKIVENDPYICEEHMEGRKLRIRQVTNYDLFVHINVDRSVVMSEPILPRYYAIRQYFRQLYGQPQRRSYTSQ